MVTFSCDRSFGDPSANVHNIGIKSQDIRNVTIYTNGNALISSSFSVDRLSKGANQIMISGVDSSIDQSSIRHS